MRNRLFSVSLTIKIIGFLILILPLSNDIKAQGYLKGGNHIQLGIGFTDVGILGNVYYARNFGKITKGLFGGGINYGQIADVNYYGIYLDGIMANTIKSSGRGKRRGTFKLNGLTGISFVVDGINDFENDQFDSGASVNYGVVGGIEAEFDLTTSLSAVLSGTGRYYIRRQFGRVRYQGVIGIKYSLGN